jgi:hypothetical protein
MVKKWITTAVLPFLALFTRRPVLTDTTPLYRCLTSVVARDVFMAGREENKSRDVDDARAADVTSP